MTTLRYSPADLPVPEQTDTSVRSDGVVYDMPQNVLLAVNAALVTGRPLLVRGAPGTGKSTLALYLARAWGASFLEHPITSRTRAQDLLWQVDDVKRLSDAQAQHAKAVSHYVEPGPLWWAMAPASAQAMPLGTEGSPGLPFVNPAAASHGLPKTVLLLDEIDKADPDVPNDLLTVLSKMAFGVRGQATDIRAEQTPFIVLTTNDERALPGAFARRVVVIDLPYPDADRLQRLARFHIEAGESLDLSLVPPLAERTVSHAAAARAEGLRPPGISEFLDALRAFTDLGITPQSDLAEPLLACTLLKAEPDR